MKWDPSITAPVPSLLLTDPTLVNNLNNMVGCDTSNNVITVGMTGYTDLTNYQYQGDYGISVVVTATTTSTTLSNSNFLFVLRVTNPCWGPLLVAPGTLSPFTPNVLTANAIPNQTTSVLLASQPVT